LEWISGMEEAVWTWRCVTSFIVRETNSMVSSTSSKEFSYPVAEYTMGVFIDFLRSWMAVLSEVRTDLVLWKVPTPAIQCWAWT
jgi:hypothetical protein